MRTHVTATVVGATLWLLAGAADATILAQVGPGNFGGITATENFEGFSAPVFPGEPFSSGGFTFDLPSGGGSFAIAGPPFTGFPTKALWQNGGASSMTSIVMTDGSDINQIQFDISNGFAPGNLQFIWLRSYNNGAPTLFDFDFDIVKPSILTMWSDGAMVFDEVRVQSYGTAFNRNLHIESIAGSASIDNVIVGTVVSAVPEPGTLGLLGLGLAALGFRRRAVSP